MRQTRQARNVQLTDVLHRSVFMYECALLGMYGHVRCGLLGGQAFRGRWSSVMPSDLFRRGALHRTSLPASAVAAGKGFAPKYSNASQSKVLQAALQR